MWETKLTNNVATRSFNSFVVYFRSVGSWSPNSSPTAAYTVFVIFVKVVTIGLRGLHAVCGVKLNDPNMVCVSCQNRVWWILAFGVSLFLCGYFILKMWTKWEETPVIVTFAEQSMPVWSIPFPAVTICPVTKTSMEKLNFTNVVRISSQGGLDNLTNEE